MRETPPISDHYYRMPMLQSPTIFYHLFKGHKMSDSTNKTQINRGY